MALVEIKVPDIGDFKEVAVIELLVKPGDVVKAEQSLITVESDKASMEIPSSQAGTVKELRVALGDKVGEGSVVLMLETEGAGAAAPAVPAAPPAAAPVAAAAAVAAAPAAAGGTVEVRVPDIGDFKEVAVIEVMVKPGDTVKAEQSLITVESDKASMEIPSSHAGVVKELKVALGDKVGEGSVILVLEAAGGSAPAAVPSPAAAAAVAAPVAAPVPAAAPASAPSSSPAVATPAGKLPHASPSVRRFARELGVPLADVAGSGPKGRITQEDVQRYVKGVIAGAAQMPAAAAPAAAGGAFPGLLPWPQVDFSKFGEVERKDLSRIKKISGANLHRNWVVIPHVTN
ncbi:MAG: E3 binding domain-containing protein, partial [Rhodoferax sp.]|nr:E3 binding domain-containing protein [Rhodoferax sp.]